MPSRYKSARNAAFTAQGGQCHWCLHPMWQTDRKSFAVLHGLTAKQARRFQCTAEHLIAQKDGGKHGTDNIVAACQHCNLTRHKSKTPDPDPGAFMLWVRQLERAHRWHPNWAYSATTSAGIK